MKSLTVVVPAYNEEQNLEPTVREIAAAADRSGLDLEIVVVDDCSRDRTAEVAARLAAADPRVRVHRNEANRGLGWNFRKGVELASKEHVAMVPGDNAFDRDSLAALFGEIGKADIVVGFTKNLEVRPIERQRISKTFTALCNALYGLRLPYFNGPCVFRAADVRRTPMTTSGFAYMAEILVRLLKSGRSWTPVGLVLHERTHGGSSAFRLKNVASVASILLRLFVDTRLRRRRVPPAA